MYRYLSDLLYFQIMLVICCLNNITICASEFISELMDMYEYHSLICLLCSDFPLSVVQQAARYSAVFRYL